MRTMLVILFGLGLGVTGVIVGVYLGLVLNGPPDLKAGSKVVMTLAMTQSIAFISFRWRVALQLLLGVVLCLGTALAFVFTSLPIFWEHQDQPHVYFHHLAIKRRVCGHAPSLTGSVIRHLSAGSAQLKSGDQTSCKLVPGVSPPTLTFGGRLGL